MAKGQEARNRRMVQRESTDGRRDGNEWPARRVQGNEVGLRRSDSDSDSDASPVRETPIAKSDELVINLLKRRQQRGRSSSNSTNDYFFIERLPLYSCRGRTNVVVHERRVCTRRFHPRVYTHIHARARINYIALYYIAYKVFLCNVPSSNELAKSPTVSVIEALGRLCAIA